MTIQRILTLSLSRNAAQEAFLRAQLLRSDQGDLIDEVTDLRLPEDGDALCNNINVGRFLDAFHAGEAWQEEAKAYGRLLYKALFGKTSRLAQEWDRTCEQANKVDGIGQSEGLRLEIRIDQREQDDEAVQWGRWPLALIPFELLHDGKSFLFRRHNWHSLRTQRNQPTRAPRQRVGKRVPKALLGCANVCDPAGKPLLPQAHFQAHIDAFAQLGASGRVECLPVLAHATRGQLAQGMAKDEPDMLVWVGHGTSQGNALILHNEQHPRYPGDAGEPVIANDFALLARRGKPDLAFLWACHGAGSQQTLSMGVAEALLDPTQGDLLAVLASYSALDSAATAELSREVFKNLAQQPDGDMEQALASARANLKEESLIWARPILHSRARRTGRVYDFKASLIEVMSSTVTTQTTLRFLPPMPDANAELIGRNEFLAKTQANLQHHACVVLEGLPGVGKTALAQVLARQWRKSGKDVAFVEVSAFTDIGNLVAQMGQWCGMDELKSDADLIAAFRDVALLLVIDNAEDMLVPAMQQRLIDLLTGLHQGAPQFRCLITSRRSLPLQANWVLAHEVPPLAMDDACALFITSAGPRLAAQQQDAYLH